MCAEGHYQNDELAAMQILELVGMRSVHNILMWPVARAVQVTHDTPCSCGTDKRRHFRTNFLAKSPDIPNHNGNDLQAVR